MKTATLFESMNLVDVALVQYGNMESLVKLCQDNGLAVDAEPAPGVALAIDANKPYQITAQVYKPKPAIKATKHLVQEYQNLIDVVLQQYGSPEAVVAFCRENAVAVDADLVVGASLNVNSANIKNKKLIDHFKKKGIVIRTGYYNSSTIPADALLAEDGTPLLTEDGINILIE